jgi:cytochrome c oxidase subunit 2
VVARGTSARPGASGGPAARARGRVGRLAALGVLAVAVLPALSACSVASTFHGFGWPSPISLQGRKMYDLWIGAVVAALLVGFFVWGLIFWCIIRYRKRGDALPVQTRYNLPIELIYTAVPFLIISVLFFYTAVTETYVNKLSPDPNVTVQVVASKWNWKFRYVDDNAKGPDGQPVSTVGSADYIPVLVVPTHERVRFVENSTDVIHSFWVPDLLFKRDVFPGNVTNKFEVTIEKEGAYVGHCAELCGTYHSMMNFEMRAVTPDQYRQFIAAKKAGKSTPEALQAIGQSPYATTTKPFNTDRTVRTSS